MKTTLELPDSAFRQAKAIAATRGITLKQFFTEALEEKLRSHESGQSAEVKKGKPWMAGFGSLQNLAKENRKILAVIEDEFETLEPEDIR